MNRIERSCGNCEHQQNNICKNCNEYSRWEMNRWYELGFEAGRIEGWKKEKSRVENILKEIKNAKK